MEVLFDVGGESFHVGSIRSLRGYVRFVTKGFDLLHKTRLILFSHFFGKLKTKFCNILRQAL